MDTQGGPVTWDLNRPCKSTAKKRERGNKSRRSQYGANKPKYTRLSASSSKLICIFLQATKIGIQISLQVVLPNVIVCVCLCDWDSAGYFTSYLAASRLPNLAAGQKRGAGDKKETDREADRDETESLPLIISAQS